MAGDNDFFLISQMRRGDRDAFDRFVRKYYDQVLHYCRRRCASPEMAEDLTEETFLHFFEGFAGYHHLGKALNYLYTIAGNLIVNEALRRKEVLTDDIGTAAEMGQGGSAADIDETQDKLFVEELLRTLPEGERKVLELSVFRGLTIREIAKLVGISESGVKYRMKKAKESLLKTMQERDRRQMK